MKTVLYARGRDQSSIERQLMELRGHAASEGWTVVAEYSDCGGDGNTLNRTGLNRLRHDAAQQPTPFEKVAVIGIDRIARTFLDMRKVVTELEDCGISIANPNDSKSDLPATFRKFSLR